MADFKEFQLPGVGLQCQSCGTTLPRVHRTLKTAGFITRERVCPACQEVNTTSERVIASREKRRYFTG